jgi:hypothetical protein
MPTTQVPSALPPNPIPKRQILGLTLLWVAPLAFLLCNAVFVWHTFGYRTYELWRSVAIVLLFIFAFVGLLRAFDLAGAHKGDPWFTDPVLVALVLFWALFPPTWFFVEYLSFDNKTILLPESMLDQIQNDEQSGLIDKAIKVRTDFLASTKLYADMAAKIWAAVGTALGAVIAFARRP